MIRVNLSIDNDPPTGGQRPPFIVMPRVFIFMGNREIIYIVDEIYGLAAAAREIC